MKLRDKLALSILSCEKHRKERRRAIAQRLAKSVAADISILCASGSIYYTTDMKTGNFYLDAALYVIPALALSLFLSNRFKKTETKKQNDVTNRSKTCLPCATEIQRLYKKQNEEYEG